MNKTRVVLSAGLIMLGFLASPIGAFAAQAAAPGAAASSGVRATGVNAMSRHRVEQIQMALNNNGEKVAVDGYWGSKTSTALRNFQKQHGLQPNGGFDHATAKQLHLAS